MTKFLFMFIALSFSLEAMSQQKNEIDLESWNKSCVESSLVDGKHRIFAFDNKGVGGCTTVVELRPTAEECNILQNFLNILSENTPKEEAAKLLANYVKLCQ